MIGQTIGRYRITAKLGEGGMGVVYRATDNKLKRDVALKVLPEVFAADPERMARFQREAEVLASLNHPNIAQIYGVEERALVMELVEGESPKGPMAFKEAWTIASQVAAGLEYAHDKGIVHRDLKPANVKITPDGVVKLLDFGLAKAFTGQTTTASKLENSPTLTLGATQLGVILGTAAYMAPEQAKGKPVDKRADIWSFGVVLYELLTGERLFHGDDVADTLAQVLTKEPNLDRAPEKARRLLGECLRKDPKVRLRDIGDVTRLLEENRKQTPESPSRLGFVASVAAGVLFIALAIVSSLYLRETSPPARVARFQVPLPEKALEANFELSPDGRYLAFTAAESGRRQLWVRPIDSLTAQALPGTEGATFLFGSPDSAFIAFFVPGKLKKIPLAGGLAQTICDAPAGRGGTWNKDGVIVFAPSPGVGLARVLAAGGAPAPITRIESPEVSQRYPQFLPDGNHFLYVSNGAKQEHNGIYVGSLSGAPPVRILADVSSAVFAPPDGPGEKGFLFFGREGALMAQRFDAERLQLSGEARPFAGQIGITGAGAHGAFSVSENGLLAFSAGGVALRPISELVWMDRSGKRLGTASQPGPIAAAALSPNEKRVVYSNMTIGGGPADLWMLDVDRRVPSRLTFHNGLVLDAIWSPDSSRIVFTTTISLYLRLANGAGKEELLVSNLLNGDPHDWAPDGKTIVYSRLDPKTGRDLWLLPMEGDRKPVPYLQTPFNEVRAQFSPDGNWMAYVSDQSGQPQVYVQSIPANGAEVQVSAAGGIQPRWRRDGRELFYVSADGKLTAVPVKTGASFEITGTSQSLFEMQASADPATPHQYQPALDGRRFLVIAPAGNSTAPPITVVMDWQAALNK